MSEFFGFLRTFTICGTCYMGAMLVLLALPQSKLRLVASEMMKYVLAAGLLLLCASPVDVIPDVLPVVGWADDLGYLVGAIAAVKSALNLRLQRREIEEIELAEYMVGRRQDAQVTEPRKEG